MERFNEFVLAIAIVIIGTVISFSVVAGLTWLVCIGLGFEWSWPLSLGVWASICVFALIMLMASAVNVTKG